MKKFLTLIVALLAISVVATAQTFVANTAKSTLQWTGKKVTGEHTGKVQLKEGQFSIENNKIAEGKFVIDMASITNEDLEGEWNEKLVGHLKSDDFFGVADHPEATLVVNSSSKLKNNKATVKGDLTIKGITKPIEFEANQNGNTFSAVITVDRTLYNVRYGSGKFFDNLGDKTIYDDFTIEVKLIANSETAMQ